MEFEIRGSKKNICPMLIESIPLANKMFFEARYGPFGILYL